MKIELLGMLFAPVNYLRIRHPEKRWFDFVLPAVIACIASLIYWFLPVPFAMLGSKGLVPQVNGLLQVLTGFYIAALAAVATFQGKGMDERMAGDPPVIKEYRRKKGRDVALTRRRFLCYLFGYLAMVSLGLFCLGVLLNLLQPPISEWVKTLPSLKMVKTAGVFIYLVILSNLATTTLLGLYYLSVRIHREDPKLVDEGKTDPPKD